METLDFNAEAVLFFRQSGKRKNYPLTIRRFGRACEAILFAAEELSPMVLKGCTMEVGDHHIKGNEIFELYQSSEFPLKKIEINLKNL
jgi:hypothetical protein